MRNFLYRLGVFGIAAWVLLWIAAVVGYILNIVEIVQTASEPLTGVFVARLIGVIAFPLGAVMGYVG